MRQTLLVLLALLVATYLDHSQKQSYVKGQKEMIRAELRRAATGVAMETMEVIYARAFDRATVGVPDDENVAVSSFASEPFPGGKHCIAFGGTDSCEAIEDFHDMVPDTAEIPLPRGTLKFHVNVEVHYVDDTMDRTGGTKTRWKQVTVFVRDVQPNGESILLSPTAFTEVHGYI